MCFNVLCKHQSELTVFHLHILPQAWPLMNIDFKECIPTEPDKLYNLYKQPAIMLWDT
jgi:hypothetical protein